MLGFEAGHFRRHFNTPPPSLKRFQTEKTVTGAFPVSMASYMEAPGNVDTTSAFASINISSAVFTHVIILIISVFSRWQRFPDDTQKPPHFWFEHFPVVCSGKRNPVETILQTKHPHLI